MKKFLRIRKDKRDQRHTLKLNIGTAYLQSCGNKLQEYVAEDMAARMYAMGWRKK